MPSDQKHIFENPYKKLQRRETEMSEKLFNLEFEGKIIPGWDIDEVKANLASLLKANEEKMYPLFSGRRFLIKKNTDHKTVLKINNAFKAAGADCVITPAPDGPVTKPPPLPPRSAPCQPVQTPAGASKPALAPADIRPKKFWYIMAVFLFLVPMIAGGTRMFEAFESYLSGGTYLMVPGETDIQIDTPGTYLIYYETSAFTRSRIDTNQPGRDFGIAIMDLATGEDLTLTPVGFNGTEEIGTTVRQAIAEVQFNTVGFYSASVAGDIPGGDGLVVRRFNLIELGKGVLGAFALFFLGLIAGPLTALAVLVKRHNFRRRHLGESLSEKEARQWAMFAHIGTFSSIFVPLGNIIAPVVVWQLRKHDSDFVVEQAKESLNFQITLMIYFLVSFFLVFIIIGFLMIFALVIFGLITVIVAGVKANDGENYRYPMSIRLIK